MTTVNGLGQLVRRVVQANPMRMMLPAALGIACTVTLASSLPIVTEAQAVTLANTQAPQTSATRAPGRIAPRGVIRRNVSPPNTGITREDLGLDQRPPNFGITREDLGLDQRPPNQGITREDLGLDQRPPNKGISREDLGLKSKRPTGMSNTRKTLRTKQVRPAQTGVQTAPKNAPAAEETRDRRKTLKQQRDERRKLKRAHKRERLNTKRVKRDRAFKRNQRKRFNRELRRKQRTHGFKMRRNNRKGYNRRGNRKRR